MSTDQVRGLLAAVAADASVGERFAKLPNIEAAVELASELGFTVTAEELTEAVAQAGVELSDEELASTSGGLVQSYVGTCYCALPTYLGLC